VRAGEAPVPDPGRRRGEEVARMFGAIAPTYDLLNHLLSLNVDRLWRRRAVRALDPRPGEVVVDLCTGTGDLALAVGRRGARVLGVDFSRPMLERALRKGGRKSLRFVLGDALRLPLKDRSADGVTVAFGVRNFEDLAAGLREMARILKPGGRLVVLEFSRPRPGLFGSLYRLYFQRILPAVGHLVSGVRGPYGYLPATVDLFPDAPAFAELLRACGFGAVVQRPLTGGIATLHAARREGEP